jgi:hypothetical protein
MTQGANTRRAAALVRRRLLALARERRRDYRLVLHSYAAERLLYRLSLSRHRKLLILRGAILLAAWFGDPTRSGGRLEFLGRERFERATFLDAFREIVSTIDDTIVFDVTTVRSGSVPGESTSAGLGVIIEATLEKVSIPMHVDIGYGDVVFPTPAAIEYPTLLGDPVPRVLCYRRETAIAEILHRIVSLRSELPALSSVRDLYLLIRKFEFEQPAVARAIFTTFRRRGTVVPMELSSALITHPARLGARWRILRVTDPHLKDAESVADCLLLIAEFVGPLLEAMAGTEVLIGRWQAGGPWNVPGRRRATAPLRLRR